MTETASSAGRIGSRSNSGGLVWPAEGWSRVPFELFCDPEIHALEDERLFRGPHWSYLGLEIELPEAGDYTTCYVGATPVVLVRDEGGVLRGFVNRCAHRGAKSSASRAATPAASPASTITGATTGPDR